MSPITVAGTGTLSGVTAGLTAASMPAGSVVQIQSTYKGDTFSTTSTSWTDITGLSVSITPTSASNDILVICHMGGASTRQNNLDHGNGIRVMRDVGGGGYSNDNKLNGAEAGNRERIAFKGVGWSLNNDHIPGGVGFSGIDDPSTTSAVTYKLQNRCQDSGYGFYLNGNVSNADDGQIFSARPYTSLIAMEIKG
jgi:guanyl-specific ribonuclease Sa